MEFSEYPTTPIAVFNCLRVIGNNTINVENCFPLRKWTLTPDKWDNYVQYIIISRDKDGIGIVRNQVNRYIINTNQRITWIE